MKIREAFKARPWLWGIAAAAVAACVLAIAMSLPHPDDRIAADRTDPSLVTVAEDGSKVTSQTEAVTGLALPKVEESEGDPDCDHDIVSSEVVVAPPMTETVIAKEAGWYLPGDESVVFDTEDAARKAGQEAGFTGTDGHPYYSKEMTETRTTTAETAVVERCTKCGYVHRL